MAIRENELVITTGYPGNMALEAASFEQKADFFEEIFGIRPILRQKKEGVDMAESAGKPQASKSKTEKAKVEKTERKNPIPQGQLR